LSKILFWHDVQEVDLRDANLRRYFMGGTINISHNLERKKLRPHAGQDDMTSLIH
jgi:hypothetical protein